LNTTPTTGQPSHAIILFDGVCNLCERSVQTVLQHDRNGYFHFASLQSEAGKQLLQQFGLPENELKSFVLIEDGKAYTRSTAALRVAGKLSGAWKLLYPFIVLPAFVRNPVYDLIAANRYRWFGKKEACWLPRPEWKERFLES
jgi:predicted DCC family thiol-disulfide oxidoreductase YuxK